MKKYAVSLNDFVCFLLVLSFVLHLGCGNDQDAADAMVQGTVTIDGVLAPRGQVTFHPVKQGPVATGPIHGDGSFSLRIGQGNMASPDESKIFPGEYIATVVVNEAANPSTTVGEGGPPLAGKRLTAIRYSQKDTSGLKFKVKSGLNVFPIEIEGSQDDPIPETPALTEESSVENTDDKESSKAMDASSEVSNPEVRDASAPSQGTDSASNEDRKL